MSSAKHILRSLQNIPGAKASKKIVVIESDDWGSIRMPSREVYNGLLKKGYHVDRDPFMKYDSLASEKDLTNLIEVLCSVKDNLGNHAKMTLNTLTANPDFDKIKDCDFHEYHYEYFTETLKKYPEHQGSFGLWLEGIDKKIFRPQFHGREHLNVDRWILGLQQRHKNLMEAFDNKMISISSETLPMTYGYMEALDYYSDLERENKISIVNDGLDIFKRIFGFSPKSFMGCCFVWDDGIERKLNECGVCYIQGNLRQFVPSVRFGRHLHKTIYHYTGQKNRQGQIYVVRNAAFEPSLNENKDYVDQCLREVKSAFTRNKPAIISAHRLNFIGYIDKDNGDKNLAKFRKLLHLILLKWPDVEFMFSDEVGDHLTDQISQRGK